MTIRENKATMLATLHLSCLPLAPLVAVDDQSGSWIVYDAVVGYSRWSFVPVSSGPKAHSYVSPDGATRV